MLKRLKLNYRDKDVSEENTWNQINGSSEETENKAVGLSRNRAKWSTEKDSMLKYLYAGAEIQQLVKN